MPSFQALNWPLCTNLVRELLLIFETCLIRWSSFPRTLVATVLETIKLTTWAQQWILQHESRLANNVDGWALKNPTVYLSSLKHTQSNTMLRLLLKPPLKTWPVTAKIEQFPFLDFHPSIMMAKSVASSDRVRCSSSIFLTWECMTSFNPFTVGGLQEGLNVEVVEFRHGNERER